MDGLSPLFWALPAGLAAGLWWWRRRRRRGPERPEPLWFALEEKEAHWFGLRYPRPGAPPVLLIHGYGGNTRNWREVGYLLFDRGFDVWMLNLRGHGRGGHRSRVLRERPGSYGFRHIVVEDVPAFIEHVYRQTGRAMVVVGHSLGGVAARACLSGVGVGPDGRLQVDADRAFRWARSRVSRLVVIGSPPHFRLLPPGLRFLITRPARLVGAVQAALLLSTPERSPALPDPKGLPAILRQRFLSRVDAVFQRGNYVRGILEVSNFDPARRELSRLLAKGLSRVPGDLIADVSRWARGGEVVSEEGLSYTAPRPLPVPVLFVAGEWDELGPYSEIFAQARQMKDLTRVWTLLIRGTSHVDLISGARAARLTGEAIAGFAKGTGEFAHSGGHGEWGEPAAVVGGEPKRVQ